MKVLVVDDEKAIVDILKFNLEKEGFQVNTAYDGEQGMESFRKEEPDLIILDIMMPKINGLDVCKMIRKESSVPIIMLTAKAEEVDKVLGLEFGAADYVTKPFSPRELVARIKVILKRSQQNNCLPAKQTYEQQAAFICGLLSMDKDQYVVKWDNRSLSLTAIEFSILLQLLNRWY